MSTATPTREDRSLAARIAFYEERPWVRPNVERWIETGRKVPTATSPRSGSWRA